MSEANYLIPNIDEGRLFISPVLGCFGGCSYCYLNLKRFSTPRRNQLSKADFLDYAQKNPNFIWGQSGTIISVGAWGDIFPRNDNTLTQHSVQVIKSLLAWGNPVQIMSKNILDDTLIEEIVHEIRYPGQLLYSTTITTIDNWEQIESGTSSPIGRLNTCHIFHQAGVPTNVLLKPFIPDLTGLEIGKITDLLLDYHVDYCTLGIMYWSPEIEKKVFKNPFLCERINISMFSNQNHLDCNGEIPLPSSPIEILLPYIRHLRSKGVNAFLKSSCVNSNILKYSNPSEYHQKGSHYCVQCGNCHN